MQSKHANQYIFSTKDFRQFHNDAIAMKAIGSLANILMLSEQSFQTRGWREEANKMKDCSISCINLFDQLQRQQIIEISSFSKPQINRRSL